MKKIVVLFFAVLLLGCNEDGDPGEAAFSCIGPPEGTVLENMINLAIYQNLANEDGFLSQISDTYIKVNDAWHEMTHWTWSGFPEDAQITALKFNIGTEEYFIGKEQFIFNQSSISDFQKDNYTFSVFMNNQNSEIIDADLYLNIWVFNGECNDVIIIND